LIVSGIPIETIRQQKLPELKKLLGLDDLPEARAEATLEGALEQLHLYRSNLQPLLEERAKVMELETNDGSPSRSIDNARMGFLRDSSKIPSSELITSLLVIIRNLGLRTTANAEERAALEEEIRANSLPLLGNIKSRLPFPDPDLGEWGMSPSDIDDDFPPIDITGADQVYGYELH